MRKRVMNFASDNVYGVHPHVMAAMQAANEGVAASYAADDVTRRIEARFRDIFECELDVFLVMTGTAANALALSAMAPPYGAIFAHSHAHIMVDECGAPEFFTGGAKMIGLEGVGGKITPDMVRASIAGFIRGEHDPKAAAVSITQSTELGSVYSLAEISAFGQLAKDEGLKLHMDGARFANAIVALQCSPSEASWRRGIDVLSFGLTKNGAMGVEAIIFFDRSLSVDFAYRRMRGGQLLSKNRFLAAQVEACLEADLWLHNAAWANELAGELAAGLEMIGGVRIAVACEANAVFAIMPRQMAENLRAGGAIFHEWAASTTDTQAVEAGNVMIRLVTSFATDRQDVELFLKLAGKGG